MNRQVKAKVTSFLTMTLVIAVPAFAQIPDGVSPGAADRTAQIEGRCPTFIWNSIPGAAFHELVGYRLPEKSELGDPSEVDLTNADQVLYAKVPGSAPAWEPELAECLTPGGNYVWFVRAVYLEEEGEVAEASEWSYGRYFSISSMPSVGEVEEAMRVLRRYGAYAVDAERLEAERADTMRPAPSRRVAIPQHMPKSVTSAKTAIKGTVSDSAGETYGVVGISNSPNGAGVAAANTNGGADLVIDGSEDGQPDSVFTQAGIDRASPTEEWFFLINSDTGVLSLNVEGTIVGDGSGLTAVDADTLDGTESSDFATDVEAAGLVTAHAASADHDGRYFTETELGTSGSSAVHWDNLTTVPAGLDDGDDDTVWPGTRWGLHSVTTVPGGTGPAFPSMAIGADGLPVIAYHGSNALVVAHCSDLACTSATITAVDSSGFVGQFPSIVIGSDGLALVSHRDGSNSDLKVAHCSNLACTATTNSTIDSGGDVGIYTSITVGADGLGLISYHDSDNKALKVAHCSNLSCTAATSTIVDSLAISGAEVGRHSSITVGVDGLPVINYRDDTNDDLKFAHCSDLNCTAAALSIVANGSGVAWTEITIGSDSLPIVSYQDFGNDYLKVAHCSNIECTSSTVTTLDGSGNAGEGSTSITIGLDGNPMIAYYDETNGYLKVAHCSDVSCTGTPRLTVVDSDAVVGRFNSIAIGMDGLPVIAYRDDTNSALKVAHCSNEFCVPFARLR